MHAYYGVKRKDGTDTPVVSANDNKRVAYFNKVGRDIRDGISVRILNFAPGSAASVESVEKCRKSRTTVEVARIRSVNRNAGTYDARIFFYSPL